MDILLDRSGDLFVGGNGDITLSDSVAQKIKIRQIGRASCRERV